MANFTVHNSAHAGQSCVEWDSPEPALWVGLNKDIGFIRFRKPLGTLEVAVDRQVPEKRVPLPKLQLMGPVCVNKMKQLDRII